MTQNQKHPRRVLVIGLDGATFDLIQPWVAQGLLPTFQRILSEGTWGPLRTVIPPLTGPAWISFMTGKNPGKHAIYDFVVRSSHSYTGKPINTSRREGESLWTLLSRANKRVGVFMVPVTYPPEPVNGFLVTGMLTPAQATDFTYPPELATEIKAAVPSLTMAPEGVAHPLGREHGLLDGLERMTQMTMEATRYLMDRFEWDFYMLVFKETDVVMHWLWRFADQNHHWYAADAADALRLGMQTVYRRMDESLAELLERAGDDTLVILMSDHGAGSLDTYFHVNTWLVDEGFMRLQGDLPTRFKRLLYRLGVTPINLYKATMALRQGKQVARTMQTRKATAISLLKKVFLSFDNVDWLRTRAYSLGNYGQLYVNLKGREPQGIVEPGDEYEQVVAELTARLESLADPRTGQPIPGRVYRRDELYHGAFVDEAPDLVFMPDDLSVNGFGLYQFPSKSWLAPTFDRSGGHRMDGILALWGPGVQPGKELSDAQIIDLAPTVLAAMGVPIPDDMDGQVLTAAFDDAFFADRPITYTQAVAPGPRSRTEYSEDEEEEIKERLRALGYMA